MYMKVLDLRRGWSETYATLNDKARQAARNSNLSLQCKVMPMDEFEVLNRQLRYNGIICYCFTIGDMVLAFASVMRLRRFRGEPIKTRKYLYLQSVGFTEYEGYKARD